MTARFDLTASPGTGSIHSAEMPVGDGSFQRMSWLPADEQPRTYTVEFPTPHFAWSECIFKFTPAASGTVELRLMGPWEEASPGNIYRQEIYWDAITGTNPAVSNGSFETVTGSTPAGWTRPFGDAAVVSAPVAPVDGARYARTWHNGAFAATLSVTGGVEVTFRLFARPALPPGFVDMPRIIGNDSPAHLAVDRFRRGVNLGNYLEAPPGQNWGVQYDASDLAAIRSEGFDHVRIPIAWHHYTGPAPNYSLSSQMFSKADFLVQNALDQGLNVIINIHHFDEFTSNPSAWTEKFHAIWRQIAAHYASYSDGLAFELLNEPHGTATTEVMNPIYAEAIRQIRETNPNRTLFVGPGDWNRIAELSALRLPAEDENIIVTVHNYEPFLFTHQGAEWTMPNTATKGIQYPGPPDTPIVPAPGISQGARDWIEAYNTRPAESNPSSAKAFRGQLQLARDWSDYYGRPVHVGEFGAYDTYMDSASRVRYYTDFRQAMEELAIPWAMWDWKAGFHYWQGTGASGGPEPAGMREAIFPRPVLRVSAPGTFRFDGAVGKTYRLHRATTLAPNAHWTPISTQTLDAPQGTFTDPIDPRSAPPLLHHRVDQNALTLTEPNRETLATSVGDTRDTSGQRGSDQLALLGGPFQSVEIGKICGHCRFEP